MLWQRGYRFLTVIYELTAGRRRLLWIGREREEATLHGFFDWLGDRVQALRFICSDMWKPYLHVIVKRATQALHVLDRFHIVARMNKAIDEVRAKEAKVLRTRGYEPILKRTRWLVLKRPEHLTEKQELRAGRSGAVQPAYRPGLLAEGGLPSVLGVRLPRLGRQVPRPLVSTHDALAARAHEEDAAPARSSSG